MCERWLGSTTKADNRVGPPDEGLSYLALEGGAGITLKDADRRSSGRDHGRGVRGDPRGARSAGEDLRLPRPVAAPPAPASGARGARRSSLEGRGLLLPAGRRHGPAPRDVPRGASLDRGWQGSRDPAAVPRGLGQRPDPSTLGRIRAGAGGGLPRALGRAARAGERPHDRAPGGLRRLRHAPGTEPRDPDLEGAALEGRADGGPRGEGRAIHPRADRLGGERRPVLLREPSPVAAADRGTRPRRPARSTGSTTTRRSSAGRSSSSTPVART